MKKNIKKGSENKRYDRDGRLESIYYIVVLVAMYFFCYRCAPAYGEVIQQGNNFVVTANASVKQEKPAKDTGYTITIEKEHKLTVNGQTYYYSGTFRIMRGTKGGLFFVVGTDREGKQVKCYNIPKEIKDALSSKR